MKREVHRVVRTLLAAAVLLSEDERWPPAPARAGNFFAARRKWPCAWASATCAWSVFRPAESLAVHIYKIYGEGSPEAQTIVWGTAALLMICVLLFNVAARIVGKALARRMTAE